MALSEDQIYKLKYFGITGKSIDISIRDYPEMKKWINGSNGKLFLSNQKDLILHGGYEAEKIGTAIMRWFILAYSPASAVNLLDFKDLFHEEDYDDALFKQRSIFIKNFQKDGECPLSTEDIERVEEYVIERYVDSYYCANVLEVSDKSLKWYSSKFKDFIDSSYLWIDCDSIKDGKRA